MPISLQFNKKVFWPLLGGFIAASLLGLFLINTSVCLIAKNLNYSTVRYYGIASHIYDSATRAYHSCDTIHKYKKEMKARQDFPAKQSLIAFSRKMDYNSAAIGLGALLLTSLIGTIAFILLLLSKKSIKKQEELKKPQWVLVFLSLFWIPASGPLLWLLISFILYHRLTIGTPWYYISGWLLHIPEWPLDVASGLIGPSILLFIIFRLIPLKQRLTFIAAGTVLAMIAFVVFGFCLFGPRLI
jgi:hypothetical protein